MAIIQVQNVFKKSRIPSFINNRKVPKKTEKKDQIQTFKMKMISFEQKKWKDKVVLH